ncbi:MAG: hypothetical protein JXB26_17585 [Candidatus Aminicenantes bacterium]|nr:hypothetical protein [Candidatus Aminicenantes bacterium]
MKNKKNKVFYTILVLALVAASLFFLIIERRTHLEFFLHLAAIPLEVILAVFIVERFLSKREAGLKRGQMRLIKSHLFRSQMRMLFIKNFKALKSPLICLEDIRSASLEDLKKMRADAEEVEYRSDEAIESVIMEYLRAKAVWQQYMDRAISFHFDEIVEDMIVILHFINDVMLFKEYHPDEAFIKEAKKSETEMAKIHQILGDGIRKFLDYAIELKEKDPSMLENILTDYYECSRYETVSSDKGQPAV